MTLDNVNKYLSATADHLGVEEERYGGGFRAIVAPRAAADFLFGMLEGDDLQGTEAQAFLEENPLFPSAHGESPAEALQRLDAKLGLLYHFESGTNRTGWMATRRFELKAQYDAEPGEEPAWYDVRWGDIVEDLRLSNAAYYYQSSVESCSTTEKRDLHALIHFEYEGAFAALRAKRAE